MPNKVDASLLAFKLNLGLNYMYTTGILRCDAQNTVSVLRYSYANTCICWAKALPALESLRKSINCLDIIL